jgi:hypothetical protein
MKDIEKLTLLTFALVQLPFFDGVKLASRTRQHVSDLAPVSSCRLAFLSPELLVLMIGLGFGKLYFFSYLLAAPLNAADIGLELLLKRLAESIEEVRSPWDRLATAHLV